MYSFSLKISFHTIYNVCTHLYSVNKQSVGKYFLDTFLIDVQLRFLQICICIFGFCTWVTVELEIVWKRYFISVLLNNLISIGVIPQHF